MTAHAALRPPGARPARSFRSRVALILGVLGAANIVAALAAGQLAMLHPVLLGSLALAYGLGVRHAFDADHIAAIDNVTRRMAAAGQRPAGVGFFFSLGHSTVVVAACAGAALAASRFRTEFTALAAAFGPIGTLVSSGFLILVALVNAAVFVSVWRILVRSRKGESGALPRSPGGVFSTWLDGLVRRVAKSWMMYPLGLVFALGFDTATEVGILALAAAQAAKGLSFWAIMAFPALFTAGMALADTAEGLMMLGAYGSTGERGRTRLYYNLAVTAASIAVGLGVAVVQLCGLASGVPELAALGEALSRRSETVGLTIVAAFGLLWLVWALVDRTLPRAGPRSDGGEPMAPRSPARSRLCSEGDRA